MYSFPTFRNARLADGRLVDVSVDGGVIVAVAPAAGAGPADAAVLDVQLWADGAAGEASATHTGEISVDVRGMLLLPALVNGHAHLDKTFVGSSWQPHRVGEGVPARVRAERAIRSTLTASVAERARALADDMVRFGTRAVRSHVDIDSELGLSSLEALLDLRSALAGRLELQIVAFPQSGILVAPGVEDLLDAALRAGADVVGGLDPAGFDGDADRHLDIVFGLADRHGVGVDIHLHDLGALAVAQFDAICRRTRALGLQGRVVVSHAYGLGTIPLEEARRIGRMVAECGVAVMTNGPAGPMPPVLAMRAEGAVVFSGSDNIRDAWWPYGDGDMFDVARTVAYQSNFRTDAELETAFDMVTVSAARALGIPGGGIAVGEPAHLVIVDSPTVAAAVARPPAWRAVVHAGELVTASRQVTTGHSRLDRAPARTGALTPG